MLLEVKWKLKKVCMSWHCSVKHWWNYKTGPAVMTPYIYSFIKTACAKVYSKCAHELFKRECGIYQFLAKLWKMRQCQQARCQPGSFNAPSVVWKEKDYGDRIEPERFYSMQPPKHAFQLLLSWKKQPKKNCRWLGSWFQSSSWRVLMGMLWEKKLETVNLLFNQMTSNDF